MEDKILNTATNRFVSIHSVIGKRLIKQRLSQMPIATSVQSLMSGAAMSQPDVIEQVQVPASIVPKRSVIRKVNDNVARVNDFIDDQAPPLKNESQQHPRLAPDEVQRVLKRIAGEQQLVLENLSRDELVSVLRTLAQKRLNPIKKAKGVVVDAPMR